MASFNSPPPIRWWSSRAAGATLIIAIWLTTALVNAHQEPSHSQSVELPEADLGYVPGANALEGRIRAPCCWNQTLDIHGSEISNALRREIRHRLRQGETAEVIEASLVKRYGERILAVPPGSPLKSVAVALSLAMGGAGIGAVMLLRRWSRRPKSRAPVGSLKKSTELDALDARLDAELAELDQNSH